jgi:hypothetical protein
VFEASLSSPEGWLRKIENAIFFVAMLVIGWYVRHIESPHLITSEVGVHVDGLHGGLSQSELPLVGELAAIPQSGCVAIGDSDNAPRRFPVPSLPL